MRKFKNGDKVKLEDGREAIITSTWLSENVVNVRIGNKIEYWYEDGLTKIEGPKFEPGDEVFVRGIINYPPNSHGRGSVIFEDINVNNVSNDLCYINSKNFFKKEDIKND